MEKINSALLAGNTDPRLNTFVIHVPVLGAEEKDVAPAMQFLTGTNLTHYWEDTGIIASHYQEILGTAQYSWDVWMSFGPDSRCDGDRSPKPDHWVRLMTHPEQFAKRTRRYLEPL